MYVSHIIIFLISITLSAFTTAALVFWPVLAALALLVGFMAVELRLYVADARKAADNA